MTRTQRLVDKRHSSELLQEPRLRIVHSNTQSNALPGQSLAYYDVLHKFSHLRLSPSQVERYILGFTVEGT